MKSLVVGFYGEGNCEYEFLLPLVERILQRLLPDADILPLPMTTEAGSQNEKLKEVACQASGYHLVVFHLDADNRDAQKAFEDRFAPGYEALQQLEVCADGQLPNIHIVPVIPIRMTEAWLLADFEAFRSVVGTALLAKVLGFAAHPHQVEGIHDPKTVFDKAVQDAGQRRGRRKRIAPSEVYKPLVARLSLELLAKIPAYSLFTGRLHAELKNLGYI
ncbi:MAG: DUF4276 family protein [Aggregatilineales bacterium]